MPKGKKVNIKPGARFGRMTIIKEVHGKVVGRRYFDCRCDCGEIKTVRLDGLTRGTVVSCGCFNRERSSEVNTKHGHSDDRIYRIWIGMKNRCMNPNYSLYANYGGRGIIVCKDWLSFQVFYDWAITNGYQKDLTIERKDVNGNYEPDNCTWLDMDSQRRNTTRSKRITFNGKTLTMRQWANEIGIDISTLCNRIKSGLSVEQALTHEKYAKL